MSIEIFRNPDEPDYDQIEECILTHIRWRNGLGLPSKTFKEDLVDVTFCCDVGSLEFGLFLSEKGYRRTLPGIPKLSAFSTAAIEPLIVPIALGRFKAKLTTTEDHQTYVNALKGAKSLGESARIGLAFQNCGSHDLPLVKQPK